MNLFFSKINNDNNEAIALSFINDSYSETNIIETPLEIFVDGTEGMLIYRQFNQSIFDDYFCNTIPSGNIRIQRELKSIAGKAIINVEIANEDDDDGIAAEDEDLNDNGNLEDDDSDNDGIPNYKDQDDDNDNILTSAELSNGIANDDTLRDTDGDGIPDYLDPDDDNDGVPTRNEDTNADGNPRDDDDDDGIPNYLDNTALLNTIIDFSLPNTIRTTYRTTIFFENLEFEK